MYVCIYVHTYADKAQVPMHCGREKQMRYSLLLVRFQDKIKYIYNKSNLNINNLFI